MVCSKSNEGKLGLAGQTYFYCWSLVNIQLHVPIFEGEFDAIKNEFTNRIFDFELCDKMLMIRFRFLL